MIGSQVKARAAGGQLTVGELREFVNALETAEVPGSSILRGRVTRRDQVPVGGYPRQYRARAGPSAVPAPATSEAGM